MGASSSLLPLPLLLSLLPLLPLPLSLSEFEPSLSELEPSLSELEPDEEPPSCFGRFLCLFAGALSQLSRLVLQSQSRVSVRVASAEGLG